MERILRSVASSGGRVSERGLQCLTYANDNLHWGSYALGGHTTAGICDTRSGPVNGVKTLGMRPLA